MAFDLVRRMPFELVYQVITYKDYYCTLTINRFLTCPASCFGILILHDGYQSIRQFFEHMEAMAAL